MRVSERASKASRYFTWLLRLERRTARLFLLVKLVTELAAPRPLQQVTGEVTRKLRASQRLSISHCREVNACWSFIRYHCPNSLVLRLGYCLYVMIINYYSKPVVVKVVIIMITSIREGRVPQRSSSPSLATSASGSPPPVVPCGRLPPKLDKILNMLEPLLPSLDGSLTLVPRS